MSGANLIPEKVIAFRVYKDSNDLLGVADVTLPSLDYMTSTTKGAGVAGELETPTIGHFGSQTIKMSFRTCAKSLTCLSVPKAHHLDIRGAIQVANASSGALETRPLKVVVRAYPKKIDPGKLEVASAAGASAEMECAYIKIVLNGETVTEIDKLNYIHKVDDTDELTAVREALGLA